MRIVPLLFAFFVQACLAQAVPMNEEAFANVAAERVRRALPEYDVQPTSKLTLEGKRSDGEGTGQLSLDRIFSFCTRNAENCSAAMDQYAKGIAETIKERNRPIDKTMVRLAVRPMDMVQRVRQQVGSGPSPIFARPVAGGLAAVPVFDFTRAVKFVGEKDLGKLGLNEDELFMLGEQNLRSTIKPLSEVAPVPTASSFGRIAGEDYASSRFLFHGDWRDMSNKLGNKLVIMLPAPDVLLYGDGSTSVGVEAIKTFAADVSRKSGRPLSSAMLLWTESGWELVK